MAKGFRGGYGGGKVVNKQQKMQQRFTQMQKKMQELQEEVEAKTFTASVGGGAVTVTVNGKKELTEVVIKPEAMEEDAAFLSDLVLSAGNEALRQAEDAMDKAMDKATGGMNLGGFGL